MKILWTKSHSILSVLIRKVTKEPVSHCAIEIDGWVIQSNLYGINIVEELKFRRECTVVYELEVPEHDLDMQRVHALTSQYQGSVYDFGALVFAGLSFFARGYLKIPLPKKNLWQTTGMFLCTEWISDLVEGKEDSMITPYGLYLKLKERFNE